MAGESSSSARTLEFTPTWALASVATFFIIISISVERSLHSLGHYLQKTKRKPLLAALQKMKDELMLMGFISIAISLLQNPVSKICVPTSAYNKWTPCDVGRQPNVAPTTDSDHGRRLLASEPSTSSICKEGYESVVSPDTLHQLHIFVFVLAVVHVVYSCLTMVLALIKVYGWTKWEKEAHDAVSQAELIQSISYRRQSTFVRYHTSKPWSSSRFIVWVVCFFQQFYIPRADYLTLRLSFITTHNLKDLYDFRAYMVRTMEDEFETIVGISAWLWGYVIVIWTLNVDGAQLYFWTSFIPAVVVLIIGTKLQHVVATLALENTGVPGHLLGVLLKPRNQLFWFNKPKLLLTVIHVVLFVTAFELASFIWHVWQFGYNTCLLEKNKAFVFGRLAIGLGVLLHCSYSTLPLYALVTQMGTSYKKAVVPKHVERVLRQWHKDAKQRLKTTASSASNTPSDSSTPSSKSLILHFKSKCTDRSFRPELGHSARLSSPVDIMVEEGSSLHRTSDTSSRNPTPTSTTSRNPTPTSTTSTTPTPPTTTPTIAESIWEGRSRKGLWIKHVGPFKGIKDWQPKQMTTMANARLQFLTPNPNFQNRATGSHPSNAATRPLQHQSSSPSKL